MLDVLELCESGTSDLALWIRARRGPLPSGSTGCATGWVLPSVAMSWGKTGRFPLRAGERLERNLKGDDLTEPGQLTELGQNGRRAVE